MIEFLLIIIMSVSANCSNNEGYSNDESQICPKNYIVKTEKFNSKKEESLVETFLRYKKNKDVVFIKSYQIDEKLGFKEVFVVVEDDPLDCKKWKIEDIRPELLIYDSEGFIIKLDSNY